MKYCIFVFIYISFLICDTVHAQVLNPNDPQTIEAAKRQLDNRNIPQDELEARLLEKGVDINNVRPDQVQTLDKIVQQTIVEIEAERTKPEGDPATDKTAAPASAGGEQRILPVATEIVPDEITPSDTLLPVEEVAVATNNDSMPVKTPIYGQSIFSNQSLEVFKVSKDIKPPDTYVLGAGDEITVSIFGLSQADFKYIISPDGYISPSNLPKIFLQGVTYGQAKKLLRSRFANAYAFLPDQFLVTVSAARNITVNIFGEMQKYGSFKMSASL